MLDGVVFSMVTGSAAAGRRPTMLDGVVFG